MAKEPLEHYGKQINESIMGSLLGLMFAPKLKKMFGKLYKQANNDPELKAALIDYAKQGSRLKDIMDTLCDRNPDFPECKKRRRRHRR